MTVPTTLFSFVDYINLLCCRTCYITVTLGPTDHNGSNLFIKHIIFANRELQTTIDSKFTYFGADFFNMCDFLACFYFLITHGFLLAACYYEF